MDGILNDPNMRRFVGDWEKLFNDVFIDSFGNISYTNALDSFQLINKGLVPILRKRLQNMRLPNVEVDSPKYTYSVRNVMLSLDDLLPQKFHFSAKTKLDVEPGKNVEGKSSVSLRFHPFEFDIENMEFYYKSKQGLRYEDYGNMRVKSQEGWIKMRLNFILKDDLFLLEYVSTNVELGRFGIDIIESKHEFLNSLFHGVFTQAVHTKMQNSLSEAYTLIGTTICHEVNNLITSSLDQRKKTFRDVQESNQQTGPDVPKVIIGVGDEEIPFVQKQVNQE